MLSGSAKKAELPGWQAAGKTGTSQDFRDAWFIGYTSQLVTGVWLGNDDNSPTKKATGGGLPVEIWSRFMKTAHQGLQPAPVPGLAPSSFVQHQSDRPGAVSLLPGSDVAAPPPPSACRRERGYVPSAPVYNGNRPQPTRAADAGELSGAAAPAPQQQCAAGSGERARWLADGSVVREIVAAEHRPLDRHPAQRAIQRTQRSAGITEAGRLLGRTSARNCAPARDDG